MLKWSPKLIQERLWFLSIIFFLHHLYADWRHFSASVNGERTNDTSGALGKNSHLGKNTNITAPNCCGFSVYANCFKQPSFSLRSQNGINQNSSTEVHDGVSKLDCTLAFDFFLLTTKPPTYWRHYRNDHCSHNIGSYFLHCLHVFPI